MNSSWCRWGAMALMLGACASTAPLDGQEKVVAGVSAEGGASSPTARTSGPSSVAGSTSALPGGAAARGLQSFDQLTKGAQRTEGPLTFWRKDDKLWIELRPKDFEGLLYFSPKLASGLGEAGIYGGLMRWSGVGGPKLIRLQRVHNMVQVVAVNPHYVAKAELPVAQAVGAAFAESLVGSMNVVSQPRAGSGNVLVDAQAFFLGDLVGLAPQLQQTYRQGYAADLRHSSIGRIRSHADLTTVEVLAHYATPVLAQPGPAVSVPSTLPDPRSLLVRLHYSFSHLPNPPMRARLADARIGHFVSTVSDYSDDMARTPKRRFVNRWRLEKKDPAAIRSAPVKPIIFWMDKNIPDQYRNAVRAGVLEWNRAFERIGFIDAIVVKQQQPGDDFDTLDQDRASIRWMTNAQTTFGAIAPIHVDPRSGEILDADIAIESLAPRGVRYLGADVLKAQVYHAPVESDVTSTNPLRSIAQWCERSTWGHDQLVYGLDVLSARDGLDRDAPGADALVQAYVKDLVMHETGHALGLRHNFRASTIRSSRELADPKFLAQHSVTGSVMDYPAINLPEPGAPQVPAFNVTLGPYDYWAIDYAYRVIAPDDELDVLKRIAARGAEPELAFAPDEDSLMGLDPQVQAGDLGSDPVAFARRRLRIAKDLLHQQERRAATMITGEDLSGLRRAVEYALRDVAQAAMMSIKQLGGVYTLRDHAGSGRDPLQPVPWTQQREALALSVELLQHHGLTVSPGLQRRLTVDYFDHLDALQVGKSASTDFAPSQLTLGLQAGLLSYFYSDGLATRLLDSRDKALGDELPLTLTDVFMAVNRGVWEGDSTPARRELQRTQVNMLAGHLLQPQGYRRSAARSQLRAAAVSLQRWVVQRRLKVPQGSEEAVHLDDVATTLANGLKAAMVRASP